MTHLASRSQQNKQPRLLFRPAPLDGQCCQDYLMRIVEANNLSGIEKLGQILGLTYSEMILIEPSVYIRILDGSIQDITNLLTMREAKHPASLAKYGYGLKSRICPACCQSEEPVSDELNLPLTLICPKHNLLLLDECPSCACKLTYLRKQVNFCDCGFDLRKAPHIPTPMWVYLFYTVFAPWKILYADRCSRDTRLAHERKSISLLDSLLREKETRLFEEPSKLVYASSKYWKAFESLLTPWPHELQQRFIGILNRRTRVNKRGLLDRFSNDQLPLLSEVIAALNTTKFKNFHICKEPNQSSKLYNGYVSLYRLRKTLKLNAMDSKQLLKSSYFDDVVTTHDKSRTYYHIGQASFNKLKTLLGDTLDHIEASNILVCPEYYLRALIRSGMLDAVRLPIKSRTPRLYLSDIEIFWFRLTREKIVTRIIPDNLVKLIDISPNHANGKLRKPWLRLLAGIVNSDIPIYGPKKLDGGMDSLRVSLADVNYCNHNL